MIAIRFLCTGGTIDKVYFDANSKYEVGSPAVKWVLAELQTNIQVGVTSVMAKDSLEMTDQDRAVLVDAAQQCEESLIVVTHGTDTMADTARYLANAKTLKAKTIVLTGALAPAIFKRSDAEFNLGTAIAAVQCCSPGVYIAMNGQIFEAGSVRKNLERNRFEAL